MEELAFLALACLGSMCAVGFGLWQEARTGRLDRALRAAGLTWRDAHRADGTVDGVRVIGRAIHDPRGNRTGLEVLLPPIPATGLTMSAESLGTQLAASIGAGDLTVGDLAFDAVVWTGHTDLPQARAVLDADTRALISAAVSAGARFDDDRWRLDWAPRHHRGDGLRLALQAMLAAHRAMARQTGSVRERLGTIAVGDRPAAVRRGALEQLLVLGAVDPALLEACLADVDAGVRLAAATALGERGREELLRLLKDGSRTWRVRAAIALVDAGGHPDVVDVLIAALDDPELAGDAATALGRCDDPRVIGPLAAASSAAGLSRAARTAIREALQAARARTPAHLPGGLTLAGDPAGGALSEADVPTDRVGLTRES